MVVRNRLELPTLWASIKCSTNWATGPMAVLTGFEPAISSVTERHDNHFTTRPLVAGTGLEPATSGLWARRATNCSTPRYMAEDEGFEPPRRFPGLSVFKTDPFNQTWVIFQNMVDPVGFEPTTTRLWAGGSDQLS